jgi:5,10-methylenetetrahydromethanopterin reductase
MSAELWATTRSIPAEGAKYREIEDEGWDGLTFTDSQNISGDPFVAMTNAVLHTSRLHVATGVTNPLTRHPAVASSAIHAVNVLAPGRVSLGVGRGDSALAHLGAPPASPETLRDYLGCVQGYLSGSAVPMEDAVRFAGRAFDDRFPLGDRPGTSTLEWRAKAPDAPKVPVFVAASGPAPTARLTRSARATARSSRRCRAATR